MSLVPRENNQLSTSATPDFDALVDMAVKTVSDSSRRIYARTYTAWAEWCDQMDLDPLEINGGAVYDFLADQEVGKSTRQRHLSAMRQIAKTLSVLDYRNPARAAAYESVRMIKAPRGSGGVERSKHALAPEQVNILLTSWDGNDLNEIRNNALINVLFGAGLRRAEAAVLKWVDVDFQNGVITVLHGKGDKYREVGILGVSCIPALQRWQEVQNHGCEYVFTQLGDQGNEISQDEPITTQRVYEIVQSTAKRTGIQMSPHTARRTFITEILLNGGALADAQEQAGHAQGATTIGYAKSVEAKERRKRLHVRW